MKKINKILIVTLIIIISMSFSSCNKIETLHIPNSFVDINNYNKYNSFFKTTIYKLFNLPTIKLSNNKNSNMVKSNSVGNYLIISLASIIITSIVYTIILYILKRKKVYIEENNNTKTIQKLKNDLENKIKIYEKTHDYLIKSEKITSYNYFLVGIIHDINYLSICEILYRILIGR